MGSRAAVTKIIEFAIDWVFLRQTLEEVEKYVTRGETLGLG